MVRHNALHAGENRITGDGAPDMLMDFFVYVLEKGDTMENCERRERVLSLFTGRLLVEFGGRVEILERTSLFDEGMQLLDLPRSVALRVTALGDSEFAFITTENDCDFTPALYRAEDCVNINRYKGLMGDTATRVVRTALEYPRAPHSKFMVNECISCPGRWSGYPPHYHPQPEIYYYRLNIPNGIAFGECGGEVQMLHSDDAMFIEANKTHMHVAGPGFALWYLCVIRHLDDDPYITPTMAQEYAWIDKPDAVIWQPPEYTK